MFVTKTAKKFTFHFFSECPFTGVTFVTAICYNQSNNFKKCINFRTQGWSCHNILLVFPLFFFRHTLNYKEATNMGKASKWIKNLLTGKKSSSHQAVLVDSQQYPKTPVSESMASAKDKRRWSFRKPSNTETYQDTTEDEQKRRALAVAVANAAAADAAAKAANEAVMRLTYSSSPWMATTKVNNAAVAAEGSAQTTDEAVRRLTCTSHRVATSVEDTAATKIQSVFRSYLVCAANCSIANYVMMHIP